MIKWLKESDPQYQGSPSFNHVHMDDIPKIILSGKMTIIFEGLEIQFGRLGSDEQIDKLNKDKPGTV